MSSIRLICPEPLTVEAFKPFGDVIEANSSSYTWANDNTAKLWDNAIDLSFDENEGRPYINVLGAYPRPPSFNSMERHLYGTQVFVSLTGGRSLVAVAPADPDRNPAARPDPDSVKVFLMEPNQGINFAKGTWHCPLFAIDQPTDYMLLWRRGSEPDLDIKTFHPDEDILFEIDLSDMNK